MKIYNIKSLIARACYVLVELKSQINWSSN